MKQENIWEYLRDDDLLKALSHNEIDEWIGQYPYVAAFHFIKARKYIVDGETIPNAILHRAATYSNNRRWLKQKLLSESNAPKPEIQVMNDDREDATNEIPKRQEEVTNDINKNLHNETLHPKKRVKNKKKQKKDKQKPSSSPTNYANKGMEQFEHKITSFTQWLQSLDHSEESSKAIQKKKKKKEKKKKKKLSRLDKLLRNSVQAKGDIISETYAELLYQQGHIKRAIEMYKALIIKYPEKSDTFAHKLEKIEKEKL